MTSLRDFLDATLPPGGSYTAAYQTTKGKWFEDAYKTIDEVEQVLTKLIQRRVDTYLATGAYEGKRGSDKVKLKKEWYVDIDCKQGGQYPDKASARVALKHALELGLPKPTYLVDSGHGYHLRYVADQPVDKSVWSAINNGLIAACEATNLEIDSSVTVDIARVLRVPGSVNFKDPDHPVKCRIIYESDLYAVKDFAGKLAGYINKSAPKNPAADLNDDLALPQSNDYAPPPAKGMLEGCPIYIDTVADRGATNPEPLWQKLIQVLHFTEDGHDYIHDISDAYPTYAPSKAERKWDLVGKSRQHNPNMGPTTCQSFEAAGATQCATCQHRGKIKSPISLAYRQKHDPVLPYPFRNGKDCVEMYDADEEKWVPAIRDTVTNIVVAKATDNSAVYITLDLGNTRLEFEHAILRKWDLAYAVFTGYGFAINRTEWGHFQALMDAFVERLRRSNNIRPALDHYGWVGDNFHYNGVVYGATADLPIIRVDERTASIYTVQGDLAVWQQCANHILSQPRQASWAVIASAFGAPLMKFTGLSGALLSIVSSGSGTGKTTALKLAQSVWGDPQQITHLDDTDNSVIKRMGTLANLPSYWDEVRGSKHDMEKFIQMIFRIAQGKEKARLTSTIKQRKAGTWSTLLTIGSNESLIEHVTQSLTNSDAGSARVFELRAEQVVDKSMSDGQARHFFSQVNHNFGGAGEVYATYLGGNAAKVRQLVTAMDTKLSAELGTSGDERFWTATIAVLLVGAAIANALKLTQFDLPAFKKYLIKQFKAQRKEKRVNYMAKPEDRALRLVETFLHEKTEQILHCDVLVAPGKSQVKILRESLRHPVVARLAQKEGCVRIDVQAFKKWVYDTNGGWGDDAVKYLEKRPNSKISRSDPSAGSIHSTGTRRRCLDIKLNSVPVPAAPDPNDDLGA